MVQQTSASENRACFLLCGKGDNNKQETMITKTERKKFR